MDKIFIKEMIVKTVIGVDEEERQQEQEVVINVELTINLSGAGESDDLDDTVDYRALVNDIRDSVMATEFTLLEALCERIASICLDNVKVESVTVSAEKVGALEHVGGVGVEITRTS